MPRRKNKVQEDFPCKDKDIITFEDIHIIINYVQMSRKKCSFLADPDDSVTMEHLFKDCQIEYESKYSKKGIKYHLVPPPEEEISEDIFHIDDDYDDEIIEEGQCF